MPNSNVVAALFFEKANMLTDSIFENLNKNLESYNFNSEYSEGRRKMIIFQCLKCYPDSYFYSLDDDIPSLIDTLYIEKNLESSNPFAAMEYHMLARNLIEPFSDAIKSDLIDIDIDDDDDIKERCSALADLTLEMILGNQFIDNPLVVSQIKDMLVENMIFLVKFVRKKIFKAE